MRLLHRLVAANGESRTAMTGATGLPERDESSTMRLTPTGLRGPTKESPLA